MQSHLPCKAQHVYIAIRFLLQWISTLLNICAKWCFLVLRDCHQMLTFSDDVWDRLTFPVVLFMFFSPFKSVPVNSVLNILLCSFYHTNGIALGMAMSVGSPFWRNFVQTFQVSRGWILKTLVIVWLFILGFWVKCLNNFWMDCHEIWFRHSCSHQDELWFLTFHPASS